VPNKLSHVQPTLSIQWVWLEDYFTRNKFPADARNKATQKDWVVRHTRDLLRELGSHGCLCTYPASFDGWLPKAVGGPCPTIIQALGYLLAHFHNTARPTLLKLMKPSQQRCVAPSSPRATHPSGK
jgi:hypothetical protein